MNIKPIYVFVSFITVEPSRIVLLRSDWVVVSQGTENSKVPSHEIGRCARVQLSIWQGGGHTCPLGNPRFTSWN